MRTVLVSLPMLFTCACAQSRPPATATVRIDASKVIGRVQPLIFGQSVEAVDNFGVFTQQHDYDTPNTGEGLWDPVTHKPVVEMVALARSAGIKMLRFPGGCLVHAFDWKKAVGPKESRPHQLFGIDEYLQVCRAIGAEPLMNVSDYSATPADAKDLVEYLNAPADAAHPWAQKRAFWGHPAPYKVKYFEMGNESDHGNHELLPKQTWTPEQYVAWYLECARGMRAVDPTIKMGALTATVFPNPGLSWNEVVLRGVKDAADFIIVHTYAVQIGTKPSQPENELMQGCLASVDQFASYLGKYRELVKRYTGKDIPLAITEYNSMFVQDEPKPYRFSYGGALFSADYLRELLQPKANVMMANYWHFSNGYWGMIRGSKVGYQRMPAFFLYRLWAQHFGLKLVACEVAGPKVEFRPTSNVGIVVPAYGDRYAPESVSQNDLLEGVLFKTPIGTGITTSRVPGSGLKAKFDNITGESYLVFAEVPAPKGSNYRLTFEARTEGQVDGVNLGVGIIDSRGWFETLSGNAIEGLQSAKEWHKFEVAFNSLRDCPGVSLSWRLKAGTTPASGSLELRNLKLNLAQPARFPAYAAVTSAASLSTDGKKLFLILFNRSADRVSTAVTLASFPAVRAKRWTVTGPSLAETNLQKERVNESETAVATTITEGKAKLTLPPYSMTAIEVTKINRL